MSSPTGPPILPEWNALMGHSLHPGPSSLTGQLQRGPDPRHRPPRPPPPQHRQRRGRGHGAGWVSVGGDTSPPRQGQAAAGEDVNILLAGRPAVATAGQPERSEREHAHAQGLGQHPPGGAAATHKSGSGPEGQTTRLEEWAWVVAAGGGQGVEAERLGEVVEEERG